MMLNGPDEISVALGDAYDEVLNAADDLAFHRPRWELLMKALQEPIHRSAEIGVLRVAVSALGRPQLRSERSPNLEGRRRLR